VRKGEARGKGKREMDYAIESCLEEPVMTADKTLLNLAIFYIIFILIKPESI
jgi:hypothetical protein